MSIDDLLNVLADRIADRLNRQQPKDMPSSNRLMTVNEVASYLRKTPQAVYHLVHQRRIPVKRLGHRVYFDRLEIDGWIKQLPE